NCCWWAACGCCSSNRAAYKGTAYFNQNVGASSSGYNLPYKQLRPCINNADSTSNVLPHETLVFFHNAPSCTPGWREATALTPNLPGRLIFNNYLTQLPLRGKSPGTQ